MLRNGRHDQISDGWSQFLQLTSTVQVTGKIVGLRYLYYNDKRPAMLKGFKRLKTWTLRLATLPIRIHLTLSILPFVLFLHYTRRWSLTARQLVCLFAT